MWSRVRQFGAALLDFALPPHCLACRQPLDAAAEYVCPRCWAPILKAREDRCPRCSCPGAGRGCANCAV
ncbi:MAG: hypothetical protein FJY95_02390 [Candidatus Handelsmanbacteria bacterium]|nr:hypothetical protein [Candidatus Handelsmanbacteria bacterium]